MMLLALVAYVASIMVACNRYVPAPPDGESYTPPPETVTVPTGPFGPSTGNVGQQLRFETGGSISSAGHSLKYIFDWDDGTQTETEFAVSGQDMSYVHAWNSAGTYFIRVSAVSTSGISSSWSGSKKVTITEPVPVEHEEVIATLQNYRLAGGHYHHWERDIQAGRELSLSWEADGPVSVYILTETQYDYFKVWGFTARYVSYEKGCSGTLRPRIASTDTYYLIINNSSLFETYKVYSAEAKVTWWS